MGGDAAPPAARDRSGSTSPTPSDRLERLVGEGAEVRAGPARLCRAPPPRLRARALREDQPNLLLAEAGTGIGKTLGYLAPASLWAEQADGAVWISTYTKALQRQLDREGARLFPDAAERRKQDRRSARAARIISACSTSRTRCRAASPAAPRSSPNWSRAGPPIRKDGDMVGGDLPGWLTTPVPPRRRDRADRPARRMRLCRLPALPRCFIERAARASQDADLVIANHALVMVNAARGREAASRRPGSCSTRAIICSTPPISTFAAALTGQEAIELRRWIVGPGRPDRGRRRGPRRAADGRRLL